MKLEDFCKSYLNGFSEIRGCRKNKAGKNILAALKIFSYAIVILPIVAYGILKGRVNKQNNPKNSIGAVAQQILNTSPSSIQSIQSTSPSSSTASNIGSTAPPRTNKTVQSEKGGFTNGGQTSFISMALHFLNISFFTLPIFPDISQLKKREDIPQLINRQRTEREETEEEFLQRQQDAQFILGMLKKVNNRENCTGEEMHQLRQILHNVSKDVPKEKNEPGDTSEAYVALSKIFYPLFKEKETDSWTGMFPGGFHTLASIDENGNPQSDVSVAIQNLWGLEKLIGIAEKSGEEGQLQYTFKTQIPFPPSVNLMLRGMESPKKLPYSFDFVSAEGKKVHYELIGLTINGDKHAFYGREGGKWVRYESEHIDILSVEEEKWLMEKGQLDLVHYRRID